MWRPHLKKWSVGTRLKTRLDYFESGFENILKKNKKEQNKINLGLQEAGLHWWPLQIWRWPPDNSAWLLNTASSHAVDQQFVVTF